jgi:hypothetical protein
VVSSDTALAKATLSKSASFLCIILARPTIEDPNRLASLLYSSRNSPHIATCVDIPLDIISFALGTETGVPVVNVGQVGAFMARLDLVGVGVHVGNVKLALEIIANLMHLSVQFVEEGRHAAGGGSALRLGRGGRGLIVGLRFARRLIV